MGILSLTRFTVYVCVCVCVCVPYSLFRAMSGGGDSKRIELAFTGE